MGASTRRLTLILHIVTSVGWLGAVAAFLVLSMVGLNSEDNSLVRAAFASMDLLGRYLIVPLSLAALSSGILQSLTTQWGLFRHYWVVTKLALTIWCDGAAAVAPIQRGCDSRESRRARREQRGDARSHQARAPVESGRDSRDRRPGWNDDPVGAEAMGPDTHRSTRRSALRAGRVRRRPGDCCDRASRRRWPWAPRTVVAGLMLQSQRELFLNGR